MQLRPSRLYRTRTGWCWSRRVCWYSWRRTGAIFISQTASQRPSGVRRGGNEGYRAGGEASAEVLEFAAAEPGAPLETTAGSAKALMADALDLRHRLPELWQLVCGGPLGSWRARKVAPATRRREL